MIQVTLQILHAHLTGGTYTPRSYRYIYEIRSFWSKFVQISAVDGSGKTDPISLPELTTDDYESKKEHGQDVMICIEVYAEPLLAADEYLSQESKTRIGVAMLPISNAIAHPHVSLWESVSVRNIVGNSEEGKLYVKVDTEFVPTLGSTPVDYFSTCTKSEPALGCPAHVIDQVRNRYGPTTNNFMDTSEENKEMLAKLDQDPEEVKAGIRWAETTPDANKIQRIGHNMITSTDFPFHIPGVEAAEKMIMTQYNAETNDQAQKHEKRHYNAETTDQAQKHEKRHYNAETNDEAQKHEKRHYNAETTDQAQKHEKRHYNAETNDEAQKHEKRHYNAETTDEAQKHEKRHYNAETNDEAQKHEKRHYNAETTDQAQKHEKRHYNAETTDQAQKHEKRHYNAETTDQAQKHEKRHYNAETNDEAQKHEKRHYNA